MRLFSLCFFALVLSFSSLAREDEKLSVSKLLNAEVSGPIGPATVYYLEEAFKQLRESQAEAIVLMIDTPGGLLTSTREVIKLINSSSKPVITVVGPSGARAASAGSFILLAGHWAMMKEGTNVGAASPIDSGGKEIGPTLKKKVFADTQALMRGLAESRGRNIKTAEKFVSDAISLTDKEALEANVINQRVLANEDVTQALLKTSFLFRNREVKFAGKRIDIASVEKRPIDHLLTYIADPQVAYMLTSFGTLGLYIELTNFGLLFPGVFGAISLILGFMALSTLPVNIGFLALLVLGVALLGAEVFVSGFGILGLGGLLAFFLGSLHLFDEPIGGDYMAVVYTITFSLGILFTFLTFVLLRKEPGKDSFKGQRAVAATDFVNGAGFIKFKGQNFKAVHPEGFNISDGDKVFITGHDGSIFIVEVV